MADTTEAVLQPKRRPGLVDRIARMFNLVQPDYGPQPELTRTTQTGAVNPEMDNSSFDEYLKGSLTRKQLYKDIEEMDRTSEEVARALNTIASNALQSDDGSQESFEVHAKNERVQDLIDNFIARVKLHKKARPIIRALVKYGDSFVEPVVSGNLEIADVRLLRPETMHRNEDRYGALMKGRPAFKRDDKTGELVPTNKRGECAFDQVEGERETLVATFYPYQIVHGRLNHDGMGKYGTSHLAVTRGIWKKLKALEEALIIGRLTRDLLKLVFYVDTTGLSPAQRKAALREFKESVTQRQKIDGRRENPFSVMTDFFISSGYVRVGGENKEVKTKVETIDPKNEGIHYIQDVEYFRGKMVMTLMVPKAHMSLGHEGSSHGVVTAEDSQYVRWIKSFVQAEASDMLSQLFDMELILHGINPLDPANGYDIAWPNLRATDEGAAGAAFLAYAQGDQIYMQEGVIDTTYVLRHRYGMDDEEVADMQELVDQEEQEDLDRLKQESEIASQVTQTVGGVGNKSVVTSGGGGTSKGPRDVDGRRKGDEGKSSSGKRLAPTKSKPKGTPPGSGRRKKTLHSENWFLLEQLARSA